MGTVIELTTDPSTAAALTRAASGLLVRRSAAGLPDVTYARHGVVVDRDRLAAYDRVCGFAVSDRVPATFTHVLAFPLGMALMSRPDFPFPVAGVIHLANRIEQLRPLDTGERLDLAMAAADLRPHERGRQFDIRATATVGDEPVWRGVSTYLHKERTAAPADRTRRTAPAEEPAAGTALWRVGREVGRDYARVSGDHNPIHTSRLGARLFGFPRPIAHGMWSKARCLAALANRLADAYTVEVAFKRPILLPATVAFTATSTGTGWSLGLSDARSGKAHLIGEVRQAFS